MIDPQETAAMTPAQILARMVALLLVMGLALALVLWLGTPCVLVVAALGAVVWIARQPGIRLWMLIAGLFLFKR